LHLLIEVSSFLMHASIGQFLSNCLQLVHWDSNVVGGDTVGGLSWQSTLKVKIDSRVVVTFSLFDLGCLCLLVCL
jgi:hypothetical protein